MSKLATLGELLLQAAATDRGGCSARFIDGLQAEPLHVGGSGVSAELVEQVVCISEFHASTIGAQTAGPRLQ